jgi:hypothetical protein
MSAVCAALIACLPVASYANGIARYVKPQQDAPARVTGCGASVQFFNNAWGTSGSALTTSVDFQNASSKTIVAVMFRLQLEDAFGTVIDNVTIQATGTFSPDTTIRGNHWSASDRWPGLGIVQCSVHRVLFSDGSTWEEALDRPAPPPVSSPSPS